MLSVVPLERLFLRWRYCDKNEQHLVQTRNEKASSGFKTMCKGGRQQIQTYESIICMDTHHMKWFIKQDIMHPNINTRKARNSTTCKYQIKWPFRKLCFIEHGVQSLRHQTHRFLSCRMFRVLCFRLEWSEYERTKYLTPVFDIARSSTVN